MAFFDNFSKKVQDVAFVATEKAQQVAAVAGEKANAVADKAKTEYEMASERRSMDKNYRAIGEWYVSTLEGDAPEAVADRDNEAVAEQSINPTALFIPLKDAGLHEQIFGDSFALAVFHKQIAVLRGKSDAAGGAELLRPSGVGILTSAPCLVVHVDTQLFPEKLMRYGDGA